MEWGSKDRTTGHLPPVRFQGGEGGRGVQIEHADCTYLYSSSRSLTPVMDQFLGYSRLGLLDLG